MLDLYEPVGENDLSRRRVLTIANRYNPEKMQIIISNANDQYGLWSISFSSGKPPPRLQGKYTSYDYAKTAVDKYLAEHRQERKIVKISDKKIEQ